MTFHDDRYRALLSDKRLQSTSVPGRNLTLESESDRARLIFSAAFRRLQQKAQVFSLEENAAVRSRLTHSLEVAQIGRFLAEQALEQLEDDSFIVKESQAFQTFVETSCLMHDIGNPPFGHFGEAAISEWFLEHGEESLGSALGLRPADLKVEAFGRLLLDFYNFDGNCQGLRILSKLQWNRDEFGLNMTATGLASYLKYVVGPLDIDKANPIRKKAGYFLVDERIVSQVWAILQMRPHTRHPVAYIMEASDDIAYCISDFEDAIENDFFTERQFFDELRKRWAKRVKPGWNGVSQIIADASADEVLSIPSRGFTDFRTKLSGMLTKHGANSYVANHKAVLEGTSPPLLEGDSEDSAILEVLREFAKEKIYSQRNIARVELAGYAVIRGLLDHLKCLLRCDMKRFQSILDADKHDPDGRRIVNEAKLVQLLPRKHKRVYIHAVNGIGSSDSDEVQRLEWLHRAHLLVDYISGMTDDFALSTYQQLSGIRVT